MYCTHKSIWLTEWLIESEVEAETSSRVDHPWESIWEPLKRVLSGSQGSKLVCSSTYFSECFGCLNIFNVVLVFVPTIEWALKGPTLAVVISRPLSINIEIDWNLWRFPMRLSANGANFCYLNGPPHWLAWSNKVAVPGITWSPVR